MYQKLGADRKRPPNTLLVSNFLTPPVVEALDTSDYKGRTDDVIRIVALDPIEVTGVHVRIRIEGGSTLETGAAASDHGVWSYRATKRAPAGALLEIIVTARNRAGAEAAASERART